MLQDLRSKALINDFNLKSVTLSVEDRLVYKTFEIDILTEGEYHLSAWVLGTRGSTDFNRFEVYIDHQERPIGNMEIGRTGWQAIMLLSDDHQFPDKVVFLAFGRHTISFCCPTPEVPAVEFIQLSRQVARRNLLESHYDHYIHALKDKTLPKNYAQIRQKIAEKVVLSNPEGDYIHESDVNFNYTFYQTFYFAAGTAVVFETKKSDPYASDPYMYLFNIEDPIGKGTWADDDSGEGWQSKISAQIGHTGYYILLIRAYNSDFPGTADLWKDGSLYVANIPLAGKTLYCGDIVQSDPLNFFVAHLTGDSRLWLQSYYTGNGIVCYNDDYSSSGDFSWGLLSRIKERVYRIRYAIVSAYSSYNPVGICDVYMGCQNSSITTYFPQLKSDDAIRSAPESAAYNCISWAGGRTDLGRYFWPPDPGNPWRGATDQESFDNFFGNQKNGQPLPRYQGAMNYTRNGATAGNAVIALWANADGFTHASVTKPGNDHPHGYDWESKPGGLMRTFHPCHALEGESYGKIVAYYRWDGTRSQGTLPMQSVEGTGILMNEMESMTFTETDKEKLYELLFMMPEPMIETFEQYYQAWQASRNHPALQIASHPRAFTRSEEYDRLLSYCREQGKAIWPLLFSKYEQGDELVTTLLADLTFSEYSSVMEQVTTENIGQTREVSTALPSQSANWTRYVTHLLSDLYTQRHD